MKVAIIDEKARIPTVKYEGDAGMDFYSLENYIILPNTFQIVHTGVVVDIPDNYVGLLKPKSGSNWLIGAGVIDPNYTGEILFKVFNPNKHNLVIRAGDPVGQMIVVSNLPATVEVVDPSTIKKKTKRGSDGGIVRQTGEAFLINMDCDFCD